jgi:putative membrane protein
MTKFIIRWAINAVALYAAIWIVPGIVLSGAWTDIIWLALIFGLLNALVRPVLKVSHLPVDHPDTGAVHHRDQHSNAFAHQ